MWMKPKAFQGMAATILIFFLFQLVLSNLGAASLLPCECKSAQLLSEKSQVDSMSFLPAQKDSSDSSSKSNHCKCVCHQLSSPNFILHQSPQIDSLSGAMHYSDLPEAQAKSLARSIEVPPQIV